MILNHPPFRGTLAVQARKLAVYGCAVSAATAVSLCVDSAQAQQRPEVNNCAIYGSGFVAVQGGSSCVRIGGRVRLEVSGRSGSFNSFAPVGAPSAALGSPSAAFGGDGINRAHMRLDAAAGRARR